MPNLQALLAAKGMSFDNYYVTDSLCCPSRSSLMRGQLPHNTGIFTNGGGDGGFDTFYTSGEEATTIGTALQSAGYATALMGKYLNGYLQPGNPAPPGYVPPGWTEWDGIGDGYAEYNYTINRNGTQVSYGSSPTDYGVDVLSRLGQRFIGAQAGAGKLQRRRSSGRQANAGSGGARRFEGDIKIPDHPIINEVMKDVLSEAMDLEGLKKVLEGIQSGDIACLAVDTPVPSQFSHEILNGFG